MNAFLSSAKEIILDIYHNNKLESVLRSFQFEDQITDIPQAYNLIYLIASISIEVENWKIPDNFLIGKKIISNDDIILLYEYLHDSSPLKERKFIEERKRFIKDLKLYNTDSHRKTISKYPIENIFFIYELNHSSPQEIPFIYHAKCSLRMNLLSYNILLSCNKWNFGFITRQIGVYFDCNLDQLCSDSDLNLSYIFNNFLTVLQNSHDHCENLPSTLDSIGNFQPLKYNPRQLYDFYGMQIKIVDNMRTAIKSKQFQNRSKENFSYKNSNYRYGLLHGSVFHKCSKGLSMGSSITEFKFCKGYLEGSQSISLNRINKVLNFKEGYLNGVQLLGKRSLYFIDNVKMTEKEYANQLETERLLRESADDFLCFPKVITLIIINYFNLLS